MNSDRSTSDLSTSESQTDADRALQRALADLPPTADAARIEALNRRVLTQWQQALGERAATPAAASRLRRRFARNSGWRARWLAGATGLALGLALLLGTWLRSSDPALDELLQPDVLSQMAAGEM